jgi:ribonuclease P protein component
MLNQTERYFLGKEDRLKSRKLIEALFKTGHSFSHFPFRVLWLPQNHQATLQAGVGVSSRFFKKATDRNRIKRLMRESYRLQKNILQTYLSEEKRSLSVFILYTGKEIPPYELVYEKTGVIISRLIKFLHEKALPHTE